jgi:lipopolysaccharide export system protein LptC
MLKSNKIRQLLALFVIVASLSVAGAIVLKVYREKATAGLLRKLPQDIDVALRKVHFTETRDGMKKWDLVADQAEYDKGREVTHLTGVHLVVAGGRTTGDITLTAGRADYYNSTRDVKLVGKVVAKSVSGMEFSTENAAYIAARSIITTASRVKFTDGTLTVEGVGMELRPETKNIRLFHEVTADIRRGAGR